MKTKIVDKQLGKVYKLIGRKGRKIVVEDQFGDVFEANASQFIFG